MWRCYVEILAVLFVVGKLFGKRWKKRVGMLLPIFPNQFVFSSPFVFPLHFMYRYGSNCDACLKDANGHVCSNRGSCDGDGTSTGTGGCNCLDGATGNLCELCTSNRYGSSCVKSIFVVVVVVVVVGSWKLLGVPGPRAKDLVLTQSYIPFSFFRFVSTTNCLLTPNDFSRPPPTTIYSCIQQCCFYRCGFCPGMTEDGQACSGHGTCDGEGTRTGSGTCVCEEGWRGATCSDPVPCAELKECSNHGTCGALGGTCFCNVGWTGKVCDVVVENPNVCTGGCEGLNEKCVNGQCTVVRQKCSWCLLFLLLLFFFVESVLRLESYSFYWGSTL